MALPYSDDLRHRIIRFSESHADYTQQDLADEFAVSKSFIEKLLRRYRTTGSSAALPHAGGQQPRLKDHNQTLQQLVATQPDVTLGELQAHLRQQHALSVSQPTLCRALQRLRLVRKKSRRCPASNNAQRSSSNASSFWSGLPVGWSSA